MEKKSLQCLKTELLTLNSSTLGRRAFLHSLPLLLAACASAEKTRYREGNNQGQLAALTPEEEEKLTSEVLPKFQKEYPAHSSAYAQKYIEVLGQRMVEANGLKNNPYTYRFAVVDSKNVNAFALPAGTVFITAPLILKAQSEAELAGVVGHEIGHIKARHTAERMQKAKDVRGKSFLYGLGGAVIGGAAGFGLGKALCSKQDRECLRRASMYGAAAGAGGGLLIQKFAFMAHSREDEMEADRIGFKTSIVAGYDKNHAGNFYKRLLEMEKKYQKNQSPLIAPFADAMSTHPPSEARVAQMEEMARQYKNRGNIVNTREFKKLQTVLS